MKYLVNFSGGLCSFFASMRLVGLHGADNVVNLFADVLIEDESLYEFNTKASQLLGVPITRVSVEMTPWELFRKEGLIGNNRFPICSVRLKREPLNAWMAKHYELDANQQNGLFEPATVVLGFDWTEEHRVAAFKAEHPTWRVVAPMTEPPIMDKCQMIVEAERLGLTIPKLYTLGFPHNNCGGRCVRAGITHWVHLYRTLPERFIEWEEEEQATIFEFARRGIAWMSMLKDRRGGTTKPMTLRDLRHRIHAGEKFPEHEWGGCGCGGATGTEVLKIA